MIEISKTELNALINTIDKAIDEILEIDEGKTKDSKAIYPLYRLTVLKNNLKITLENMPDINNIYNLQMRQRDLK